MPTLSQTDLENRLLSSVIDVTDLGKLVRVGVTSDAFVVTEPPHAQVWLYLLDHAQRLGALPTVEDLTTLHGFEATTAGDLDAYAVELISRHVARQARQTLLRYGPQLDRDPLTTVRTIAREFDGLQLGSSRRLVYVDRDAEQRLERFDAAAAMTAGGRVMGLPTGLKWFDEQRIGFMPGTFTTVLGTSGVGKSWLLMHMAVAAYLAGRKVLVFSPEMSADEQSLRVDVLLAHQRSQNLSNHELVTGTANRERYAEWLRSLQTRSDFVVIDSAEVGRPLTYEDVWQYTAEFRPDEVCIDGLHLLASERSRGLAGWELLKNGTSYLKAMAQQQRVALLAVHQGGRAAAKRSSGPPTLDQAGYGFSVVEISDQVISLGYDKTSLDRRVYFAQKIRNMPALLRRRYLHWAVDRGAIFELDIEDPEVLSDADF